MTSHTNTRISSMGYQQPRERRSLSNPSKFAEYSSTTTHNNNQPFSYTKNPRELIYAHVVAGDKDRTKRTVHSRVMNAHYDDRATPSPPTPTINHFVYETNKENRRYDSPYRTYPEEPKHVTTVLLNSSDEDYNYNTVTKSYLNKTRPTPAFYEYSHSRSHQNLSSSSRETSPAPISAKLVRDADRRRNPAYSGTHTHYQYMNEKLGYMTPSEYSESATGTRGRSFDSSSRHYDTTLRREAPVVKSTEYRSSTLGKDTKTSNQSDYRNTNNKYNTYSSVEKKQNRRNEAFINTKPSPPPPTVKTNGTNSNGNGGGFISTLMRRNKEKPLPKGNAAKPPPKPEKEAKPGKKPRRFLSLLMENFGRKAPVDKEKRRVMTTTSGSKGMTTDSEIEEAERRRDGEYHSWSSVDDFYRSPPGGNKTLPSTGLRRGESYHFESANAKKDKTWRDTTPTAEYRSSRTETVTKPRYQSATLGRPSLSMQSTYESDAQDARTKSLDRRSTRRPPVIVVTPHSPEVDLQNDEHLWRKPAPLPDRHSPLPDDHHRPLNNKLSGLSKSSNELDNRYRDTSKLRYFGDTDMEGSQVNTRTRTFGLRNGSHIARKDKYLAGASPGLSSESDMGGRQSSNQSSQRSVYLHAPAIAEIPPNSRRTPSRDDNISNYSGSHKQAQHLTRSVSVLAPWRPRHYKDKYELNYNRDGVLDRSNGRPPKPPRSPTRKSLSPAPNKSASSESLLRDSSGPPRRPKQPVRSATLGRSSASNTLSRSKSVPGKDERVTGWLNRRKKERKI